MPSVSGWPWLIEVGVAACLLVGCGERAEEVRGFDWPVAGTVLTVDARAGGIGAVVDLEARAAAEDCARLPLPSFALRRLRLLDVPATDRLHVISDRGEEVVALAGIGAEHPGLPAEVVGFVRETARPALLALLQEPGIELLEVPSLLLGQRVIGEYPDDRGLRLVAVLVRRPGHPDRHLAEIVLERGWGWSRHPFVDVIALHGPIVLARDGAERRGLFALSATRAVQDHLEARAGAMRARSGAELTARARQIQRELAGLIGWTPAVALEVAWIDDEPLTDRMHAAWRPRPGRGGAAAEPPSRENVARFVQGVMAWSPPGPQILLRRRMTPVTEAQMDVVLAHEIAHQYQEETWSPEDFGMDRAGYLPIEGHAAALADLWAARFRPGLVDFSHPGEAREFRALMEAWGAAPDEVVARFRGSLRDAWVELFTRTRGLRAPAGGLVERVVARTDERLVVELTNPGATLLRAQHSGDWFVFADAGDLLSLPHPALDRSPVPSRIEPILSSPPFNLLLPPGQSIRVALSLPEWEEVPWPVGFRAEAGAGADGAVAPPGAVLQGCWSPTPPGCP